MIWFLGILLFIISLFFLWLKIRIIYNETLIVTVGILFFKYKLIPAKEKKEKPAKKEKEVPSEVKFKEKKEKEKPNLLELISLIKNIVTKIIEQFNKHLVVQIKELKIKIAADDAAKTAILYGAVSQSVVYLLEIINNNVKKVKKGRVLVVSDFTGTNFDARINITFKLRVWQILSLALKTAFTYIKSKSKNSEV